MSKKKHLSNEELAALCSQVSILLHAGVAPIESMRILLTDTDDDDTKKLLSDIIDLISNGSTFYEAFESVGVFPEYMLNTIKLGEESGAIDDVMGSLADYYERETQISESVKNAITYPLIMIAMMLIIIVVLITKVLPIFNRVFVQLGSEMTGFAASLLKLGTRLNTYSVGLVGLLLIILFVYLYFSRTEHGRKSGRKILSKFILTRDFYKDIAKGRFASGIALAFSAGLDTFATLDLVMKLVEHKETCEKINICRKAIESGDNFPEGLKKAGIFTNVNNRMISVGFKSGEVEKVMNHIADEYERKSEKKMSEIIAVIEPTLVIILSIIVGLILLSVILPLMGIMSSIG